MATANDIINGALRLIGVLAEGETPSPETSNDSLTALNEMIESWSTERLAVYCTQDQVFTWPANTASRTLGPSGNFVGTRPILLDPATYFVTTGGLSFPIQFINQMQYDGIALKTQTSTYPQVMFVNMTHPDIEMTVYPIATEALIWHFVSVQELAAPATLATTLAFPPGYKRAFRYNLACELAPEFGATPSTEVSRIAMYAKRNLKRINNPNNVMSMPYPLLQRRGRFDIFVPTY